MASKILCSHMFCDTKQMGRGERSLCNHITYPTEKKASEYTCALLNCRVFPGNTTYATTREKTSGEAYKQTENMHRKENGSLLLALMKLLVMKETQQRKNHVYLLSPT